MFSIKNFNVTLCIINEAILHALIEIDVCTLMRQQNAVLMHEMPRLLQSMDPNNEQSALTLIFINCGSKVHPY